MRLSIILSKKNLLINFLIVQKEINIIHEITPYKNRVKYYILTFIGCISLFGVFFSMNNNGKDFSLIILIFLIIFGILVIRDILKTKLYLADFFSDSNFVKIIYFEGSREHLIETNIENIEVKLKNTSVKSNFSFEIILNIDELKFILNKDFDWNFTEMKQLFEYVRFHNNILFTEKEKDLLSRIDNYIEKVPF
jgi:hypothetical protein